MHRDFNSSSVIGMLCIQEYLSGKEPNGPEGLVYVGLMIDTVEGLRFRNQSHNYFSDCFLIPRVLVVFLANSVQ